MVLEEKKSIIDDLANKNIKKTEELKSLIQQLGIEDEDEIQEIVNDSTGVGAHKRRQKNLKKNIENIRG